MVPRASARGRVLAGFFTSPAAKVMPCQASAENREPDCETQSATKRPNPVKASRVAVKGVTLRVLQKPVKLALTAAWFQNMKPMSTSAASANTLADVKTF